MFFPVIPVAGEETYSDLVMGWISGGANAAKIHLYANDYVPDRTTVLANFVEATNPGLTAKALPVAVKVGSDPRGRFNWTFPTITFTITAGPYPAYVFGFWVDCNDPVTGLTGLLWAQRFPTGFAFHAGGDSLPVNIFQSFGQCPPDAGPYANHPHRIPDRRVRQGSKLWPPKSVTGVPK